VSQAIVPPIDRPVDLAEYDPEYTGGLEKDAAHAEIERLRVRLDELQNVLYADRRFALLVVLQGIDTAGKDSTTNSVFQVAGPIGSSVVSFGAPNEEELAHDYLWRYHVKMPRRGNVTVFNRSHYEAVLVERVKGIVGEGVWRRRYDEINAFEHYLTAQGTVIMKFFLHISKDEQRERLQERVDTPRKRWKFRMSDLEERKRWDDYQAAYADMLTDCNTREAPWHIIPANRKWARDVFVARALVERLERLDLRYPQPEEGIGGLVVE
jgi:PPK2 family polyphosphate:nucleotide phosphotransferase